MTSKASKIITDHFKAKKATEQFAKKDLKDAATNAVQEDKDLVTLKQFDLNWKYGPCIGITRLERWERAHKFNLDPPQEVKDILAKHAKQEEYVESVWNDYKIL